MKWLNISAKRSPEVYENYRRQVRSEHHSHTCPEHGEYVCPWSICSVQRGTKSADFHCRVCIMRLRGLDTAEVDRLRAVKTKQIKNKRGYRDKLSKRPTNKTARGVK